MKNLLLKILLIASLVTGFAVATPVVADVTANFWTKSVNGQLYTNSGNGIGNAIINVAGCNGCGGGGGTIGGTIAATQVGYGTALNTLGGDVNFRRNLADDRFNFASNIDASFGVFYNGTAAPNPLGNHAGLGIDFRAGTVGVTLGWVGFGNGTRLELADNAIRTDLYTQDFYLRGYNADVGIFAEITPTYADVSIGDVSGNNGDTMFRVVDSTTDIAATLNGNFTIANVGSTATWFDTAPAARTGCWGDCDNVFNSTQVNWNDSTSVMNIQGTSLVIGAIRTRINGNLKQPSIIQVSYGTVSDFSAEPDFQGRSMIRVLGSTGATTILLPTGTVAIPGTIITIKDAGLIALTSNITIDAGIGNSILGTTSAQTFVMNTNGLSVTLIKSASNTWDVI